VSVLTCTHCGETKPLSEFYYHRTRKYRLHRCRICWLEYRRAHDLVHRRNAATPTIKSATVILKKFGPMTAKDIAKLIGGTPRGIAQVLSKSGVLSAHIPTNKCSAIWSIAGHNQTNQVKKRRAVAAAVRRCAAKPLSPPPPPPTEDPRWRQPEHDVWFAQLQAEVAARKAAHNVMRERV